MAIWYTDNLTGNDTTGDGSIALPYKTIVKALTVGTNGDEIRVAGSGFTALPGTCSHTNRVGTTWNTSQSLVGLLAPGDIITYNDPNFGDQKFFYKVFSVTATNFVTDGATNFDENTPVTISKVTTQHYYTTTTSVTFENINAVSAKYQFNIRGGWTNNFTAQDGFTAMTYHSTSSATAISGVGFTGVNGGPGMYFDRFMFTHLTTGIAGHTYVWYPGTLAYVYSPTSGTACFGANPTDYSTYPAKNLYLSNTKLGSLNQPQYAPDGTPGLKYDNCWFMRVAVNSPSNGTTPIKVTNLNVKSYSAGAAPPSFGCNISVQNVVDNLTISSYAAVGAVETATLVDGGGSSLNITTSVNRIGQNAANLVYALAQTGTGALMINTPAQNLESVTGDGTTNGWCQMTPNTQATYFSIKPSGYIKDSEGFKTLLGCGQVLFADPTETSTGTNSLRLSKPKGVVSAVNTITPIESIFVDSIAAKTITVRCKSSVAGSVVFALYPNANVGNISTAGPGVYSWAEETKTVGTDWTDITYTGLGAYNANVFLNSFVALGVQTGTMPGKYIWIDSVTIS